MALATLTVLHTYTVVQCTEEGCGVHYGLDDEFIAARRRDRKTFYCPNGHTRWYPGKTAAQEAEEQRQRAERLQKQLTRRGEDLQRERRSHSATKGQLTKTKKRIGNGVCPYCNRHFADVERHMGNKHPECVA